MKRVLLHLDFPSVWRYSDHTAGNRVVAGRPHHGRSDYQRGKPYLPYSGVCLLPHLPEDVDEGHYRRSCEITEPDALLAGGSPPLLPTGHSVSMYLSPSVGQQ